MLVLSRKPGESVAIGPDIVVTIIRVRGDKVRLGIAAPLEVPVDREEIRNLPDYDEQQRLRRSPPE